MTVEDTDDPRGSGTPLIIPLRAALQPYAWGDSGFITRALRRGDHAGPCAEAWFGAHGGGPTECADTGRTLAEVLRESGPALLGTRVHDAFDGLPYLLKLLAAARPLSIQVHPDAAQAAEGCAREDAAGIERTAAHRNYRDPRPKPELIVALTRFRALCGFRAPEDLVAQLERIPELLPVLRTPPTDPDGLASMLRHWFEAADSLVVPALTTLLSRLRKAPEALSPESPEHWALRAQDALGPGAPPDRGLLFCWLLELVELEPGEGLFLGPGLPHAYLEGAGIEVMGNSDNVLRGGLTPKHVDVDELLDVLRCDARCPARVRPDARGRYGTPAREFELHRADLGLLSGVEGRADGPEILLLLADDDIEARLMFEDGGARGERGLAAGAACLLPHGRRWRLEADSGTLWRVTVPQAD